MEYRLAEARWIRCDPAAPEKPGPGSEVFFNGAQSKAAGSVSFGRTDGRVLESWDMVGHNQFRHVGQGAGPIPLAEAAAKVTGGVKATFTAWDGRNGYMTWLEDTEAAPDEADAPHIVEPPPCPAAAR